MKPADGPLLLPHCNWGDFYALLARILPRIKCLCRTGDADARPRAGVEQVMAYYLERVVEDGPLVRARVIRERDGLSYAEIFEIGEPVHLRTIRLCPKVDEWPKAQEDKIWWIQGFSHAQGVASVYVATKRGAELGDYTIPINELVKVPAMLRIALACAD